jgi:hypothetical protein
MTLCLTRSQLEAARIKLAVQGVGLIGDSGTVSHDGVIVDYVYIEPSLTLTIAKKPLVLSLGFVEGRIRQWFSSEV